MNDAGDDYDRMPVERVDSILRQLRPDYWTPERLRGAPPSDKRAAVRQAFTARGRGAVRAGKTARPSYRPAADPVSEAVGSVDATPKSDMMSDLPPTGFTHGTELTKQLSSEAGCYNYGDLDPRIVTDAKAAATRIRSLIAEIVEATVAREIQIGRELLAIKARLGHGHFGPWLAAEFGWSDRQARRFMTAARGKVPYLGARAEDVNAYMTAPSVAEDLVATMKTKIAEEEIPVDGLWWVECCAGNGNILRQMPPDKRLDINPLASGILQADFFSYALDPTIPWVLLTNPPFSDDGPTRIFNRAAAQKVQVIGLVLPAHLRTDKAQWVNRLDPFYECIHDQLLPKWSFLRNGKPHDVPARFQIWMRRDTRREPLIEQTKHPDLIWVPKSRSDEATIWICRRGPDIGEIIGTIGTTTPPESYYGVRCSVDAVLILWSIRWRDVLDPLPIGHALNMSRADIVRAYVEAADNAQPDANDDEPHDSTESLLHFVGYGLDVLPDQPASSLPYRETRQSTYEDVPADQYLSWWTRLEQIKRVLCPDGSLMASTKGTVIDGEQVLELMLTMRPAQAGPDNILFILGCCTKKIA